MSKLNIDSKKFDKYDIGRLVKHKTKAPNTISCGVTWVDGRCVFKDRANASKFWYGICHYSSGIFACSPLDYIRPTMTTTILVAPPEKYCERAYSCLNTKCPMNKFNAGIFEAEFNKTDPDFVKSVCKNLLKKGFWANEGKFEGFWRRLQISTSGGTLKYDEKRGEEL